MLIFFTVTAKIRTLNRITSKNSTSLLHQIPSSTSSARAFSQSTSIPKKVQRVRDHGFDNYMEIEKKMRKVLKFQALMLSHYPSLSLPVPRLETLARRFGFKQLEPAGFILKFPHVFDIFEHPVQRVLHCRLTRKALLQIDQEKDALAAQVPEAVTRLRKLLMLSNTGGLPYDYVHVARKDFGLPDDFESSVILKNPQFFRLLDDKENKGKYIEVIDKDPTLCVCAIEKLREKGIDAENIRFSFLVNFPPGFKIGKYYKIAVWKWQRLPYWSPYDDISGYDMRSLEAQKRLEKRAVAMIHEILSLTVEKKITLERIAHFRMAMNLPKKLKDFLLQHQGIFYISTRGNQGKLHTIFLREAYRKGELVEPNDLYLARRKLAELILVSPRKAKLDRGLVSYRRERGGEGVRTVNRDDMAGDVGERACEENLDSGSDFEDGSDYTEGDDDGEKDEELGVSNAVNE